MVSARETNHVIIGVIVEVLLTVFLVTPVTRDSWDTSGLTVNWVVDIHYPGSLPQETTIS